MPEPLVDDDLWAEIEPLLPKKRRRNRDAGRKPMCNRRVLAEILYVLKFGIAGGFCQTTWAAARVCVLAVVLPHVILLPAASPRMLLVRSLTRRWTAS